MGSNIGSCVVAIIAGITSGTNAKRTALIHLTFNVFGVVVFMLVGMAIRLGSKGAVTFGTLFEDMFPGVPQTQLAMFHTIFNVVTVVMALPITKLFVKFVTKVIPDKKKKDEDKHHFKYLDEHFLSTPPIAVAQVRNEVLYMAEKAMANLNISLDTICSLDLSRAEQFKENEEYINFLNKGITKFNVKLAKLDLSNEDSKYTSTVFKTVTDFERVGDYAENIMEYAEKLQSTESAFSPDAQEEIKKLQGVVGELYQKIMQIYSTQDTTAFREAYVLEETIDRLTEHMSNMHIERLAEGTCTADVGALYLALTSNVERIADHFINVADGLLPLVKSSVRHSIKEVKHEIKDEFKSAEESAKVFEEHLNTNNETDLNA